MPKEVRNLVTFPVEILRNIVRMLLASDQPAVGARGLMLQDCYLDPVRHWRAPEVSIRSCTPYLSCQTSRGARSGQTTICYVTDKGPSHSALDLLAVCRLLRQLVLADALFWGEGLLLHPPLLPSSLSRALSVDEPRLWFVGHGGSCLCILHYLRAQMERTVRIDLSLPSTDETDNYSPSQLIRDEMSAGAPVLEDVELRFDWAHAHEDAREKQILLLPAIRTSRLLNATFALAGDTLDTLFMAAEEAAFRWIRADIYHILRLCPRLQTLSLQMALVEVDALTRAQRDKYAPGGFAELNSLKYLHICDKRLEWFLLQQNITFPPTCRVHPDIRVSMRGDPNILADTCFDSVLRGSLFRIGTAHPFMALRMKHERSAGRGHSVPEYLSVSFGDDIESAMSFRDPVSQASAGSFTARNASFSLQSNPANYLAFDIMHFPHNRIGADAALRAFLRGCRFLDLNRIGTFILDSSTGYASIGRWDTVLRQLTDVECIVVLGIPSFQAPEIISLATALCDECDVLEDITDGFPCRRLRTIRVPQACDAVPQAAISLLNAYMRVRIARKGGPPSIAWTT